MLHIANMQIGDDKVRLLATKQALAAMVPGTAQLFGNAYTAAHSKAAGHAYSRVTIVHAQPVGVGKWHMVIQVGAYSPQSTGTLVMDKYGCTTWHGYTS